MSKDPAFLFYPGDWTLGTIHMTLLEKGAYIELLMLQFSRDKFTLAYAKHMLGGSFDLVWPTVSEKFKTDGTYFWNERLNIEKEKRSKFTASRRNNAFNKKKDIKNNEHMDKHMDEHMDKHMENENENENKDINKEKRGVGKKELEVKVKYAEFVEMKSEEYDRLILDHGEIMTKKFITALDNYKGSSGKKYKSDYRAILSWVIEKVKNNPTSINRTRNAKPTEPSRIPKGYDFYADVE